MPLYEYKCQKCKFVHEALQKINDPPLKKCPACEGPLKKIISSSAIQFKGSGWYVTDYAKKKEPEMEKKPKEKPKSEKKEVVKKKKESSTKK